MSNDTVNRIEINGKKYLLIDQNEWRLDFIEKVVHADGCCIYRILGHDGSMYSIEGKMLNIPGLVDEKALSVLSLDYWIGGDRSIKKTDRLEMPRGWRLMIRNCRPDGWEEWHRVLDSFWYFISPDGITYDSEGGKQ